MKYSQLPPKLQELVKERCKELKTITTFEQNVKKDCTLLSFFPWNRTKEGSTFWSNIEFNNIIPEEYKNTNDIIENFEIY